MEATPTETGSESPVQTSEPNINIKMTDRERHEMTLKYKKETPMAQNNNLFGPSITPIPLKPKDNIFEKIEVVNTRSSKKQKTEIYSQETTKKNYACDKCKACDEFVKSLLNKTQCSTCGCDLINHLKDGEESEDEDEAFYYEEDEEDAEGFE